MCADPRHLFLLQIVEHDNFMIEGDLMKKTAVGLLSVAMMLVSFNGLQAETVFDGEGTAVTLETFGNPGGASIEATGGNPDGYLRLTEAINGQNNYATFDLTDAGTYPESVFTFDFLIDPEAGPSADGFSFSYADTANYGVSGTIGAPPFTAEDPAAAGVLGFGFRKPDYVRRPDRWRE